MTTLQLLISTIDEGIDRVRSLVLPQREGVGYVISWQHSAPEKPRHVPQALQRPDIVITHLQGRGLSRNRNNALAHATADICLLADDDCRYTREGLQTLIDVFDNHPDIQLATFQMRSAGEKRTYPARSFSLNSPPRGYMAYSIEIAFRREAVQGVIRFNEHFGLGAERFHCGEEEIFLHDALHAGLSGRFFPITVVTHDDVTTDHIRVRERGVLMAKGAYLYIGYPAKMFLYPFPIAWRLKKNYDVPLLRSLRYMFSGLAYIIFHPSIAKAGRIAERKQER